MCYSQYPSEGLDLLNKIKNIEVYMGNDNTKALSGMDMTTGSIPVKILKFSIPLMLAQILEVLFNMSDVAVVGKFAGPIALGAVGSTSILVTLFTGILLGLASGVNALTALHIGSKDDEGVKRTVHTAVIICLAGGILITVFGILFSHNILALMNTKDELIDGAVLYLRIYLLGMPALGLYNFGNAVLSAAGDTKRPLYYLAFAGVVNVILNLFFVIVCHLGVAGVALASMISQFISAFLILRALLTGKEKYCLRLSEIRFDKRKAAGILKIGIPSAFQYSLFAFANLFVQSSVNSFDHVLVEGNSAAANADPLVYDMMAAFYTACSSFIAQNFGARKKKRILQTYLICLFYSFITSLVLGVGIYLARYPFLYLFTSDKAVVEAGITRLSIMALSYGCFHCCLKRSWKDSCSYFCCCYGIMRISYHLDIYDIRLFPYHPVALHPICIFLGNHCNCGEYIFLPCLPPYTDR